ncbi:MAG: PIG-L deacetylase family protein [Acidimicrobiales bacterium]
MTLIETAPKRALAIYAHPDDADVSCGGTLARWAATGAKVRVVVCTSGDKGSMDANVDKAELIAQRAAEVAAAAEMMGLAGHQMLGWPDGELENDLELRAQLVEVVRSHRPDIVIAPDPTSLFFGQSYVNHRDHRVVGYAALDAVAPAAASPLYFPDRGEPHAVTEVWLSGSLQPDSWVDIEAWVDIKTAALRCHETQLGEAGEWLRSVVSQRAEDAGRQAGVRFAEGFRRLVLAG